MTAAEERAAWGIYDDCMAQTQGLDPAHCEVVAQGLYPEFVAIEEAGSGNQIGQFFGNPANWFPFLNGGIESTAGIMALANGQPYPNQYYNQNVPTRQERTTWWIIGGVALIVLVLLIVILLKK